MTRSKPAVFTALFVLQGCIMVPHSGPPSGPPSTTPAPSGPTAAGSGATLREAAASAHRRVGTALVTWNFGDARYRAVAARQFDSLTPENEMKWQSVHPQPDTFAFEGADALVAFAAESGMRVRGHTLVWHQQLAPWVKDLSGEALRAAMIGHVERVVGRYKGRIAQWDVVNEALADGAGGELRGDSPFTALGPTYLDDAFRAAHRADPGALLFYNDYEIEKPGAPKTEAALRLVTRLKESGVPISGVGLQMHVDPRSWPTAAQIRENMERFAALGLLVEITEMDVPVGELPGGVDDKLERQRAIAHDIVAACVAVEKCSGVTLWGFTDKYSWLNDPHWGALRGRLPHLPLPFDADYAPKPMHAGIVDAFLGK